MTSIALLALVAATLTSLFAPLMRRAGFALGAIDRPGWRKVHAHEVSRLGGVAVWGAVLATVAVAMVLGALDGRAFQGARVAWPFLLGGAALVAAVGVVDDVRGLGAGPKLLVQCSAAALVVAGGCVVREVTNPFTGGATALGWLAVPVTVLWVVGITNALNLVDGLDGLASGVGLIVAGTLCLVSLGLGRTDIAVLAGILAGALVGFLYFNFNPATIFLGDSGSLFLGYALAVLAIESAHKGTTAVLVLAPMLALGFPIVEMLLTVARRLLVALHIERLDPDRNVYRLLTAGPASVMHADRDHIHHRLMAIGLSHRRAVLVLYGACVLLNVAAAFTVRAAARDTALVTVAVALASFLGVRKLGYHEPPRSGFALVGPHALLALADAACLLAAYAGAVVALHGGALPANAGMDILRAAVGAGVLELAVLLLNGVYRDQPARRQWRRLAGSLALGALAASAGLYATRTGAFHEPATMALDLVLAAALLAGTRGAAAIRRRVSRARSGTAPEEATAGGGAAGQDLGLAYRALDPGRNAA